MRAVSLPPLRWPIRGARLTPARKHALRASRTAWPVWVLVTSLALACAPGAWAQAAPPKVEKRMALVVGNARYPGSPLNNPENDARVVGSTLRRLGFDVSEHVNLPVKEFRRVLREYARKLQNEDGVGVFYYAGHGVQIAGRNYLLPVDVNLRDEDEVRDEAVDVDELFVSRLERARAQVRIVILDACRDNPFGEKTRSLSTRGVNSGLAEMAARGALIAYSSAPGATAEDGPPGTNSVYTRHLVQEMLTEGIEIEQMFKNVRVKVLRDTQQRQIPWVNTSLTANFSFNPSTNVPAVASREDLTRLQTLLEQRDREQKRLEEEIRQLRAGTPRPASPALPAPAPALVAPGPATPSPAKAPAPQVATTPAPSAPPIPPLAPTTASPPPRPPASTATATTAARPPSAPPAASSPPDTTPPTGRNEPRTETRVAAGRKLETRPERCVELLTRAQLGEPLTSPEMTYLQKDCR